MDSQIEVSSLFRKNKCFCVLPWIHIYGSVDGVWGRCCMDNTTYYDKEYKYTDPETIILRKKTIGCINTSRFSKSNPNKVKNLKEVFNSQEIMDTRRRMLKNEPIEPCKSCYEIEANGGVSYRNKMNDLFKNWGIINWVDLINSTSIHGFIDQTPLYIDIRFGNQCNLKCIMCNYPTSSKWGEGENQSSQDSKIIDPYIANTNFWLDLENAVEKVSRIYFAGGEPFLQKGHLRLLELLISKNLAKKINLVYSTNLTFFPEKFIYLLKEFKSVDLGVSCDGIDGTFEFIRKGASWKKFIQNLFIAKNHFKTSLLFTAQLDNIFHIVPFINWAKQEDLDIDFSNILIYPENLSLKKLTHWERENILKTLFSCKENLIKQKANKYITQLQIVIDFLKK